MRRLTAAVPGCLFPIGFERDRSDGQPLFTVPRGYTISTDEGEIDRLVTAAAKAARTRRN